MSTYEVYALRYCSRANERSDAFYQYHLYHEPDGEIGMDYYFWLVRSVDRVVLVDTGFNAERGAALGRNQDTHPRELLSRMGVSPEDVDHVILSHAHYDHVGNLGLFPNATFSMARSEFEFWTGPLSRKNILCKVVDEDDIAELQRVNAEGRMHFVDGPEEILPGITVTPLPGHTPGQMITRIATAAGDLVLASDAAHYYEEIDQDRPFTFFHDIEKMFVSYETLRELEAEPGVTVIAGHDPRDGIEFETVAENCLDLCRPTGAVDRSRFRESVNAAPGPR
jgi:glyoxylase-like metal-dependent hydrolase (beta-lactamase superfamily II)